MIHNLLNQKLPFILIGDANLNAEDPANTGGIQMIKHTLQCKQFMPECTTDNNTVLDHIYSNRNLQITGTIDSPWSDHKFIYAALDLFTQSA